MNGAHITDFPSRVKTLFHSRRPFAESVNKLRDYSAIHDGGDDRAYGGVGRFRYKERKKAKL